MRWRLGYVNVVARQEMEGEGQLVHMLFLVSFYICTRLDFQFGIAIRLDDKISSLTSAVHQFRERMMWVPLRAKSATSGGRSGYNPQ